jgi:prolyl-tRNA synthetase
VAITVLRADTPEAREAGERLYAELVEAGIDTILDDRVERPGVKFADAELVGFPYRVTVGPRGLENGVVEVQDRATGVREDVAVTEAAGYLRDRIYNDSIG